MLKDSKKSRTIGFPLEGLVTLKQILSVYPVSRPTIYKDIKTGRFPKQLKKGRSSFWDAAAVRSFLRSIGSSIGVPE
jgi:predicted DNA-binding transcriptional regulator AlpA